MASEVMRQRSERKQESMVFRLKSICGKRGASVSVPCGLSVAAEALGYRYLATGAHLGGGCSAVGRFGAAAVG